MNDRKSSTTSTLMFRNENNVSHTHLLNDPNKEVKTHEREHNNSIVIVVVAYRHSKTR